MSTKTRQTTPHVPKQRGEDRRSATNAPTAPPQPSDHRVRNISLIVAAAVIVVGAFLVLWFTVFSGSDTPQAPTSPNNISQGNDGQTDFLRRLQEQPVGPERSLDGSDTTVPGDTTVPDEAQAPGNGTVPQGAR